MAKQYSWLEETPPARPWRWRPRCTAGRPRVSSGSPLCEAGLRPPAGCWRGALSGARVEAPATWTCSITPRSFPLSSKSGKSSPDKVIQPSLRTPFGIALFLCFIYSENVCFVLHNGARASGRGTAGLGSSAEPAASDGRGQGELAKAAQDTAKRLNVQHQTAAEAELTQSSSDFCPNVRARREDSGAGEGDPPRRTLGVGQCCPPTWDTQPWDLLDYSLHVSLCLSLTHPSARPSITLLVRR